MGLYSVRSTIGVVVDNGPKGRLGLVSWGPGASPWGPISVGWMGLRSDPRVARTVGPRLIIKKPIR